MYPVHSSVFTKCGFIMRPILISEDDEALFNATFTPRVAVTYQNHIKEIRRMVKQQGIGFWIRFITSFRSHSERHRLMDGIVFSRAEAVFVEMLHLLTCGDNLNELTRLVAALRAMQAAITANDYHVLMDPVLRVLMTGYDKPLDGLRLYFRFMAGLVVMFRRWRQVQWRTKKESDSLLPWEPPLHWQEITGRDYSEWTFEGHLLCMFGPELPHILGLPHGLPCWMPDELRAGHMLYPAFTVEEIPVLPDMNGRGNRNSKKKCRRRRNHQYDDNILGNESYSLNAGPSSGDSGVCLIEQAQDAVAVDLMESQKAVTSGGIAVSLSNASKEDSATLTEKESSPTMMTETDLTVNSVIASEADIVLDNSPFSGGNIDILCATKGQDSQQGDGHDTSDVHVRDSDDMEDSFIKSYRSGCDYYILPDNSFGDWRRYSHNCEDQFANASCFCSCSSSYVPPYDQYLHIYRRDGPPRILLGSNNFRSNSQMEEVHSLGRPSSWVENPGTFVHSSHSGYFETPVLDYINPSSDMRRRGQQNRRFRQKRGRQPSCLATIEECFDPSSVTESLSNPGINTGVQNDGSLSLSNQKRQWHSKKRSGVLDSTKEGVKVEESINIKTSITYETSRCPPLVEINTNAAPADTLSQDTCSKGYALAVCGLLSRRSGKVSEIRTDYGKQEENVMTQEIANTKSALCEKPYLKKDKIKSGKPSEDESTEKSAKSPFSKDVVKDTDRSKKFPPKPETSTISYMDFGKNKINKMKLTHRNNSAETEKADKMSMDFEHRNSFQSYIGKDSKSNVEIGKNSGQGQEEEKGLEKKRKWKSVWTRRREADTCHPDEKLTVNGDTKKERDVINRYESDRRDGVPENVPDILKQIENSELKSFWKDNYETPKPQRKSRPKRDSKWRQVFQDNTPGNEFNTHIKKEDVTPVVKLDVVPAVEPKDKDNFPQDVNIHLPNSADVSAPEIGWYEESLAEDKDRDDRGENRVTDPGECRNPCGTKKNKNKKWKRKQRSNRRVKDERNSVENVIKGHTKDESLIICNENLKEDMENCIETFNIGTHNASKIVGINTELLNEHDHLVNNIQKDKIFRKGYTVHEENAKQMNEGIIIKDVNIKVNSESGLEKHQMQKIDDSDHDSVACCKSLIQDIIFHLPENPRKSQIQNNFHEDTISKENKLIKEKFHNESFNSCKFIQEEIKRQYSDHFQTHNVQEPNKNHSSFFHKCIDTLDVSSEQIISYAGKKTGSKSRKNEAIVIHRRRQVYLAKTLKHLAVIQLNISLPTKRHCLRYFFMNGEILKAIEGHLKKDPELSSDLPQISGTLYGIAQAPPRVPKKKLLLRRCDNCHILEKSIGEYGECVRCKEIPTRLPRVYCNKTCQSADWKRRHRAEHKQHDSDDQCAFV